MQSYKFWIYYGDTNHLVNTCSVEVSSFKLAKEIFYSAYSVNDGYLPTDFTTMAKKCLIEDDFNIKTDCGSSTVDVIICVPEK